MTENIFSLMDILQIALTLFACYACYIRGWNKGVKDLVEELVDKGVLKEEDVTD